MLNQINLTEYTGSFHVSAHFDYTEKSWKWDSGSVIDDVFWLRDDHFFYPDNHDLIQVEYEICGEDIVVSWIPVSNNNLFEEV